MKTSELIGPALDWAVAKAEGPRSVAACYYDDDELPVVRDEADRQTWTPSTDWSQGGPIIEREKMQLTYSDGAEWGAYIWTGESFAGWGPTPLIAAMRCFCCSKLGDEIDIPEELCQQQKS